MSDPQEPRSSGRPRGKGTRLVVSAAVGAALLVAGWLGIDLIDGSTEAEPAAGQEPGELPECELATLPEEADEVVDDILAGGPFAYPENDDTHFGNYEGRLPEADGDYYREFTVETPGLDHRGPRRIVTGGDSRDPDVWYYTDDHYESFCEIPDAD